MCHPFTSVSCRGGTRDLYSCHIAFILYSPFGFVELASLLVHFVLHSIGTLSDSRRQLLDTHCAPVLCGFFSWVLLSVYLLSEVMDGCYLPRYMRSADYVTILSTTLID